MLRFQHETKQKQNKTKQKTNKPREKKQQKHENLLNDYAFS
jgi:hypothetical protein